MSDKKKPCKKCKLKKDYKKNDFVWIFGDKCPEYCLYKEKEVKTDE